MIKEQLQNANFNAERDLLFSLCSKYDNYKKIKKYISEDDFQCPEYKKVFQIITSMYNNASFKAINKSSIEIYSSDKNMSMDDKTRIMSFVEFGKMQGDSVDFDGTYAMFRKINGMNKLMQLSNKYGSIENMFYKIYQESDNAEQIKRKLDYINKHCFKEYRQSVRVVDMSQGMEEYVRNRMFVNDGRSIDFLKQFFFLQQYSKGIHVGVTFWGAHSGMGKTSTVIPIFSIPILESGQKLLSIHNEQEEDEIRQLYLMAYIAMIKKDTKGIFRQNFNYDGRRKFTDEQYEYLCQCAREFEIRYKGRLEFVFTPRFTEDELEALIEEYHRDGFDNVLLDTFKQEDSTNGWEGLDNLSKKIDGLSKDLGLKIICTIQLAQHMSWRKYLTANCIGKAKSIKEIATSLYMFRWLRPEELPNIKYSCFKKDQESGKYHWVTEDLPTKYIDKYGQERQKNYIAMFNDKQRKSECGQIILYEVDLGRMYFNEIGITNSIKNDDNGR